jgi:hypothetical protein
MQALQKGMEDLSAKLHSAEIHKTKWPPITDIIFDQLPQQLNELKVILIVLSNLSFIVLSICPKIV